MKALSFLLMTAVALVSEPFIKAQDIEGLLIGSNVTKEQVIKVFGVPTKYVANDWPAQCEFKHEWFVYESNAGPADLTIELADDYLDSFTISSQGYCVFTTIIKNGIKVGDDFSVLKNILKIEKTEAKNGGIWYRDYSFMDTWNQVYIFVKDGKIAEIIGVAEH